MSFRFENISPQFSGVVSNQVLNSIGDQDQYFVSPEFDDIENEPIELSSIGAEWLITFVPSQISSSKPQASANNFPLLTYEAANWLEFITLTTEWKKNRKRAVSVAMEMANDPSYLRIIGMGPAVIPCILQQLQNELLAGEPDHWFVALWATSFGANPIQPKNRGNIHEMAKDWIKWGELAGLINAKGMGSGLPAIRWLGSNQRRDNGL